MYFHHGIEGTVGDVGGNMNVMQQTTDEDCIAMLCFQKDSKEIRTFQGSCKKKKLVVKALVTWETKRLVVN